MSEQNQIEDIKFNGKTYIKRNLSLILKSVPYVNLHRFIQMGPKIMKEKQALQPQLIL